MRAERERHDRSQAAALPERTRGDDPAPAERGGAQPGNAALNEFLRRPEQGASPALSRILATSHAPNSLVQRVPDWLGDLFDSRDNEEYLDSMEDLAAFRTDSHQAKSFQSTTRFGMFDAVYDPKGELKITCRCRFIFEDGKATEFPAAKPEDLKWTDQKAMDDWKTRFLSTASTKWSSKHVFYCQKDWWESLVANVSVEFVAVEKDEHFALTINKIPPGGFRQSSVTAPDKGILWDTPGSGDFDSEDMTPTAKPGGTQVGAVHEAGHMLGLDDEYGTGTPEHSGLVQSEFGHGVARGSDGRIMSGGMDIQEEHGVTFLEALKEATGMTEWSHTAKTPPKPVPAAPGSGPPATPSPAPAPGVTPPSPPVPVPTP